MKRLLNTLYITTPESYLARDGDNIIIKVDNEIKFRMPIINLENIVCFNYMGASPALMKLCCDHNVAVTFLSSGGRFIARVIGKVHGNVFLRRTQYRWADNEDICLRLSKKFILSKLYNSRITLQRAIRDHKNKINFNLLSENIKTIKESILSLEKIELLDVLRGIEGESSRSYFKCFNELILSQKNDFFFEKRIKRPPTDKVNALISFLYTILANDVASALESVGLDPQVGYLHKDRPGRNSLALDIMEEFRSYLVDRFVMSIINRKQINGKGFLKKETGAVIMEDDTKKIILTEWQKRKKEIITHPYLNEKIPLGLLPYSQALLLSRHLRGDLEDYPPFLWK